MDIYLDLERINAIGLFFIIKVPEWGLEEGYVFVQKGYENV